MKKIHIILPMAIFLIGGNANADNSNTYPINPCNHAFNYSTCTANGSGDKTYNVSWACHDACEEWLQRRGKPDSQSTNNTSHVITKDWTTLEFDECPNMYDYETEVNCTTSNLTIYSCAPGYYGTPTSSDSGCTACPSKATCSGDDTFLCDQGYYQSGNSCKRCPASGGIYGTTAGTGATAITECYLPANTTMYDGDGYYQMTQNCYYKL